MQNLLSGTHWADVGQVKRALATSTWVNYDEWEVNQQAWSRTREVMDRMYTELNKVSGS
jgi:hypothetical protein